MSDPSKPRLDVHEAITSKIVAAIAAGAGKFEMPWHRPGVSFEIPVNALTGKAYRGSNILALWIEAGAQQFERQIWATYRQWNELGAQVRKGEKGSLIVKYGEWQPKTAKAQAEDQDAHENDDEGKRLYAKPAYVFNLTQVDGFAAPPVVALPDLTVRLAHVDAYIAATGAEFREAGQRAFYRHKGLDGAGDFIQMPPRSLFVGTATSTPTESYESTRLHELAYWTGAANRLDRKIGDRFGDKAYSFEELVAELSAAFLCAELKIANTPRPDHAQYIANWLEVLKGDKKAIFSAAAMATSAVAYLNAMQPEARDNPAVAIDSAPIRPPDPKPQEPKSPVARPGESP